MITFFEVFLFTWNVLLVASSKSSKIKAAGEKLI